MNNTYKAIVAFVFLTVMTATNSAESVQKLQPTPMGGMGKGMHHGTGGMGMGMHHGMGGMMAGMTEEQKDQHMRSMQEHMLKMHDLSNQILAEKDPTKKEELKTRQLKLMKEHHAQMMGHHQQMMPAKPAAKK